MSHTILTPPPPLTDFQRHALTLFITKKREHYAKKDSIIEKKYRWLDDQKQRDQDLDGVEISESSLEKLKKKRADLGEEKHRLFEQLKSLLSTGEEEPTPYSEGSLPGSFVGVVGVGGTSTAFASAQFPSYYTAAAYPIKTEPVTPLKQKPSPLDDKIATKPSELSPVRDVRPWEPSTPKRNLETKEDRMDSFAKALTDTISKARLSEKEMIDKFDKTDVSSRSNEKWPYSSLGSQEDISATSPTVEMSSRDVTHDTSHDKLALQDARAKAILEKDRSLLQRDRLLHQRDKNTHDKLEVEKTSHPTTAAAAAAAAAAAPSPPHPSPVDRDETRKSEVKVKPLEKAKKTISADLNSSALKRKDDEPLPPAIKISKDEIHSKVMSWPTSYPYKKQGSGGGSGSEDKSETKKESGSGDNSGSSLLEFAFQSALFGNSLYHESTPSPNRTGAAAATGSGNVVSTAPSSAPPAAGGAPTPAATPATPSLSSSTQTNLIAALSMSYGSKKTLSTANTAGEEPSVSKKRERSPDNGRSPSPIQVYHPPLDSSATKPKSPPPPPPPPPRANKISPSTSKQKSSHSVPRSGGSSSSNSNSSSSTSGGGSSGGSSYHRPVQGYTPSSPVSSNTNLYHPPTNSFHSPTFSSFLSPTHSTAQFPSPIMPHSPIRSPMLNPYSSPIHTPYPPGMLPPPPLPLPPGMVPPPHHLPPKPYHGPRYM